MALTKRTIGSFIEQISIKNKDGKYSEVLGVAIEKEFMPSVANLIGTDLKKYFIVSENEFAFNPMHVGRDKRLPIALYKSSIPALVSPAYFCFKVTDSKIDNEYLMLLFKSNQFDHLSWFRTDSSVRGGLTWDDFCNLEVNIPDIEEQKRIVKEYKIIEKRKDILMEFNKQLEKIIDNTFLDNIGKIENETAPIFTFGNVITGKTPSTYNKDYYNSNDIPFIKTPDMHDGIFVIKTNEYLSKKGADSQNNKYIPPYTVIMSCIGSAGELAITTEYAQTNQQINAVVTKYPYFLYSALKKAKRDLLVLGDGSTTMLNINKTDFSNFLIISCDDNNKDKIENTLKPFFKLIESNSKEICTLSEYKNLLLNKIA